MEITDYSLHSLAAGHEFSLVLNPNNWIEAFGRVNYGQTGVGQLSDHVALPVPVQVKGIPEDENRIPASAISVSAGGKHSLILLKNGHVYGAGNNEKGQLGTDATLIRRRRTFERCPTLENIVSISAGYEHNLCLDKDGRVWAFGRNNEGQLGFTSHSMHPIPKIIPDLPRITQIAAGFLSSLCLDEDGQIWGFGLNNYGQLGPKRDIPKTSNWHTVNQDAIPMIISGLPKIVQIAHSQHTLALDEYGDVWSFGLNELRQLGLPSDFDTETPERIPTLPRCLYVAAGNGFSLVIDIEHRVWFFGNNDMGQSGLRSSYDRETINQPTLNEELENIVEISAGVDHVLALDTEQTVWAFGGNFYGQLGSRLHDAETEDGDPASQSFPVKVPIIKGHLPRMTTLRVPEETVIYTTFPIIQALPLKEYRVRDQGILEFEDQEGLVYLARATYSPDEDLVTPPPIPESYYDLLEANIEKLEDHRFRDDLVLEHGNRALEFVVGGKTYIAPVQVSNGQIFPPVE